MISERVKELVGEARVRQVDAEVMALASKLPPKEPPQVAKADTHPIIGVAQYQCCVCWSVMFFSLGRNAKGERLGLAYCPRCKVTVDAPLLKCDAQVIERGASDENSGCDYSPTDSVDSPQP